MKENLFYLMTRLPKLDKNKAIPLTPAEIMKVIHPESDAYEFAQKIFCCLTIFNALMMRQGINPPLLDIFSPEDINKGDLPDYLKDILQPASPLEVWQSYYSYLLKHPRFRYWGLLDLAMRNLISALHNGETIALAQTAEPGSAYNLTELVAQLKTAASPEAKDQIVFNWQLSNISKHLNPQPFSEKELLLYLITLMVMVRAGRRKE